MLEVVSNRQVNLAVTPRNATTLPAAKQTSQRPFADATALGVLFFLAKALRL